MAFYFPQHDPLLNSSSPPFINGSGNRGNSGNSGNSGNGNANANAATAQAVHHDIAVLARTVQHLERRQDLMERLVSMLQQQQQQQQQHMQHMQAQQHSSTVAMQAQDARSSVVNANAEGAQRHMLPSSSDTTHDVMTQGASFSIENVLRDLQSAQSAQSQCRRSVA